MENKCMYCNSFFSEYKCPKCSEEIINECRECHLEIAHNIIIFGAGKPSCGNQTLLKKCSVMNIYVLFLLVFVKVFQLKNGIISANITAFVN